MLILGGDIFIQANAAEKKRYTVFSKKIVIRKEGAGKGKTSRYTQQQNGGKRKEELNRSNMTTMGGSKQVETQDCGRAGSAHSDPGA